MMTRRVFFLIALFLVLQAVVFGGVIRDGSLTARSDGNNIYLHWISEDESGVLRFEIERMAGVNGDFMFLSQVSLQGNNSSYAYTDDSAFLRSLETLYQYRIKVIFANGTWAYSNPVSVTHYVASVTKRTWGSIKAMFR